MPWTNQNNALKKSRRGRTKRLPQGLNPPWAWYQYMKLVETAEAILAGMAATTTVGSRRLEQPVGAHLRLVDSDDPQESAPPRHVGLPVQMPM